MSSATGEFSMDDLVAYIAQPVYSIRAWLSLLGALCFLTSVGYAVIALPAAANTGTFLVTLWEAASGAVLALLLWSIAQDIRNAVDSGQADRLLRFMIHVRWIIVFLWVQLIAGLILTVVLFVVAS